MEFQGFSTRRSVVVLDFGSQYSHLIIRRCREVGVEAERLRYDASVELIKNLKPIAVLLSGGPASSFEADAPHLSEEVWQYISEEKLPMLGICYGMQEIAQHFGGTVFTSECREAGAASLNILESANAECNSRLLLEGIPSTCQVWMSHRDLVTKVPPNFVTVATSPGSREGSDPFIAVICEPERRIWGVQFHPEVTHTTYGKQIFERFFHTICQAPKTWSIDSRFAAAAVEKIRSSVGPKRHVIGAISGGVDSTVAAALVQKAIGPRFHGFLVDTGLLRNDEAREVISRLLRVLPGFRVDLLDAKERFFNALREVVDPEIKRKIIGKLFVDVLVEAKQKLQQQFPPGEFDDAMLLQGTLYTDIIESSAAGALSHTIKTHHNVGGLPESMALDLLEPLKELFKDEVRQLGLMLELGPESIGRHPFPGPGLAIRIIGAVTPERVSLLQRVDEIFINELRNSGEYEKISQAFAVLLPETLSVGVVGDKRTYGQTVVLRAVETTDFMTVDWYPLPHRILQRCSTQITNSIQEITRVCYDISSKPPATVEWE